MFQRAAIKHLYCFSSIISQIRWLARIYCFLQVIARCFTHIMMSRDLRLLPDIWVVAYGLSRCKGPSLRSGPPPLLLHQLDGSTAAYGFYLGSHVRSHVKGRFERRGLRHGPLALSNKQTIKTNTQSYNQNNVYKIELMNKI